MSTQRGVLRQVFLVHPDMICRGILAVVIEHQYLLALLMLYCLVLALNLDRFLLCLGCCNVWFLVEVTDRCNFAHWMLVWSLFKDYLEHALLTWPIKVHHL